METSGYHLTRNPNLTIHVRDDRGDDGFIGGPDWWTGLAPDECPGFAAGVLRSLPLVNTDAARDDVLAYFDNTWTLTELLFSGVRQASAFYQPPYHRLRHPLIFYYAHPAVVYVNKLRVAGLAESLDSYFETIFETGVDEMSWDDMSKNDMEWPGMEDVWDYRRRTYELVRGILTEHPDLGSGAPILGDHPLWAVFMGMEHERIHLETSSVLIRELPDWLVERPQHWPELSSGARPWTPGSRAGEPDEGRDYPQNPLIDIPRTTVVLGKPVDHPTFGWDNEYGRRQVTISAGRATRHLISNGEFYQFVVAGGYRDERWWDKAGWSWKKFRNVKWPTFWVAVGPAGSHQYALRTIFDVIDMPWSWPAVVNYYEARAYARWKQEQDGATEPYRLLTEAEHAAIRGDSAPHGNLELCRGSECPVTESGANHDGFFDPWGNVWVWGEDVFNPLDGFSVHPFYDDFSTPCFDGEHQMIMGGSFISTGDEASRFARFHFRPHFFQHAGFRIVCSAFDTAAPLPGAKQNKYERDDVLNQYMCLHYGQATDIMPHGGAGSFPARCARELLLAAEVAGLVPERALDIGCAVGGAVFELARECREVVGIDMSRRFIEIAENLRQGRVVSWDLPIEGDIAAPRQSFIDDLEQRGRARFLKADACALPSELEGFDLVLMANLLDRLGDPAAVLERMGGASGLVRPGGLLMVTSPWTWLSSHTPRSAWLGGKRAAGEVESHRGLCRRLEPRGFELMRRWDMPLYIREHARKYELILADATLWRRAA